MSYNVHIIREENNNEISFEEIRKLTDESNDLELKDEMKIDTPFGAVITVEGCFILYRNNSFESWWKYENGKIISNYGQDENIIALKKVAHKLNAKVIGDEGEEY